MAPKRTIRKLKRNRRTLDETTKRISAARSIKRNIDAQKNHIFKSSLITNRHVILPKTMVRSETITRSVLGESKKIVCNELTMACSQHHDFKNKKDSIFDDTCVSSSIALGPSQEVESDSFMLHNKFDMSNITLPEEFELSQDIYGNILNCISEYVEQTMPDLLQTNVIDKMKMCVEKIFLPLNSFSPQSVKDNKSILSESYSSCPSDMTIKIQNPTDTDFFIQDIHTKDVEEMSSTADSIISISLSEYSLMHDSPEHCFYPHRLN